MIKKVLKNISKRSVKFQANSCTLFSEPRSSCSQMFFKIGVLENSAIFTGKHLCWSFFFFFKKKILQYRCFHVNIAKFLRTAFFIENLRWLLLRISHCTSKGQLKLLVNAFIDSYCLLTKYRERPGFSALQKTRFYHF